MFDVQSQSPLRGVGECVLYLVRIAFQICDVDDFCFHLLICSCNHYACNASVVSFLFEVPLDYFQCPHQLVYRCVTCYYGCYELFSFIALFVLHSCLRHICKHVAGMSNGLLPAKSVCSRKSSYVRQILLS